MSAFVFQQIASLWQFPLWYATDPYFLCISVYSVFAVILKLEFLFPMLSLHYVVCTCCSIRCFEFIYGVVITIRVYWLITNLIQ